MTQIKNNHREVCILDFETTGLSPRRDRIIEVGVVKMRGREIVGEFSRLMNPGIPVPFFITRLTGISQQMVLGEASPEEVMPQLLDFVGACPILAHNAAFDRNFYFSEMTRAGLNAGNGFMCTMLLARRLLEGPPNFRLSSLAQFYNIPIERAHRALDDAKITAEVWNRLQDVVDDAAGHGDYGFDVFEEIRTVSKRRIPDFLATLAEPPQASRV